jgi:hypothetical protein
VVLLVMKVLLAPLLLAAGSFAAWRWGSAVGGWLLGLPLISGPVSVLLFVEHGPRFAESAARGTLLGLLATGAFIAGYSLLARRARWWLTLPLAYAACLAVAWGLSFVNLPISWAALLVLAVLAALSVASRRPAVCGPVRKSGVVSMLVKMAFASVLVVAITSGAGALGPHLAGLLAPLPVLLAFGTACAHRSDGLEAVRGLLGGALAGSWGGAAFFAVVALELGVASPAVTYTLAMVAALAVAALAMRAQQPAPAVVTNVVHRVSVQMRRERHLPRVRAAHPAFIWMLLHG